MSDDKEILTGLCELIRQPDSIYESAIDRVNSVRAYIDEHCPEPTLLETVHELQMACEKQPLHFPTEIERQFVAMFAAADRQRAKQANTS